MDFLPETLHIREGDWKIAPLPKALQRRRIEITGPTERKMVINALNAGADSYMSDFEDSNSPSWDNQVTGQINLRDAIRRNISVEKDGKTYTLNDEVAVLQVRPRGWHLDEKHVLIDGQRVSGSLFDFTLYFFHNAKELVARGAGPFFYLPKLQSHREARLWNDVFIAAQDAIGMPRGTIKATVLIETLHAAFEMEEILYELREHSAGLNAGRWDYIFSCIKAMRNNRDFCLADRSKILMTVPFMRAYALTLIKTCHKRGAPAIGGMSALIPNKKDPEANEKALSGIRADKHRDVTDGYDGGWVAHPGLVEPALAEFVAVLGDRPNQFDKQLPDVNYTAADLLDFRPEGPITETGLRTHPRADGRRSHGRDQPCPGVVLDPQPEGRTGRWPQGDRRHGARSDSAGARQDQVAAWRGLQGHLHSCRQSVRRHVRSPGTGRLSDAAGLRTHGLSLPQAASRTAPHKGAVFVCVIHPCAPAMMICAPNEKARQTGL